MKKTIIANTFTPRYDEIEDRIRLAINYQDISNRVDLMITRSFILDLIPATEEFIDKHYTDEIVIENSLADSNFQEKTDKEKIVLPTDGVNLELLRTNEELLIEVNFAIDAQTKNTTITFSSKNITAKAVLNALMMQQIVSVIKTAIPNIKWGISYCF